jgi:ArsR family transcriptional regulator, nickel/cobalt-responsive transcriptional repressor
MKDICCCGDKCKCSNCVCGPQATLFGNLATPSRLQILLALKEKPQTVSNLQTTVGMEQSALSHALKSLEKAGLVSSKKEGRHVLYSPNKDLVEPLLALIDSHVEKHQEQLAKPCCCK